MSQVAIYNPNVAINNFGQCPVVQQGYFQAASEQAQKISNSVVEAFNSSFETTKTFVNTQFTKGYELAQGYATTVQEKIGEGYAAASDYATTAYTKAGEYATVAYDQAAPYAPAAAGVAGVATIGAGAVAYKQGYKKAGIAAMVAGAVSTASAAAFTGYKYYTA